MTTFSYPEMQVKCLEWLLAKEKAIGVPAAEGYFESILPLEVHILRRKKEAGQDVGNELERLERALEKKDVKVIPPGMLPP